MCNKTNKKKPNHWLHVKCCKLHVNFRWVLYLCVLFAVIFALLKVFHCVCNWKIISVHLSAYFQILNGLH